MASLVNSNFETVESKHIFICMDIGVPSGKGCSKKRTRGARTGKDVVMTKVYKS